MSEYSTEVIWQRGDQLFTDNRYSRRHVLRFDGGVDVAGSASPQIVPLPMSETAAVDPEECFVASLSSCHMLWFLSIAAGRKFCVDRYHDQATGLLQRDPAGRAHMSKVTLHPAVKFSGERLPSAAEIEEMHHQAHEACFIANSVKTEIVCEPIYT
jgi:organic hydroperoxide reductase OsmC/OhrA